MKTLDVYEITVKTSFDEVVSYPAVFERGHWWSIEKPRGYEGRTLVTLGILQKRFVRKLEVVL